jgi:hypothetical protein
MWENTMQEEMASQPPVIDLTDSASINYWCRYWNVTEPELIEAVQRSGADVPAVAFALGKPPYSDPNIP